MGQFRLSGVGAPPPRRPRTLPRAVRRGPRRGAPRRVAVAPVSGTRGPLGLVVLVSGTGSNLQALLDAADPPNRTSASSPSEPTATAPAAPSGPSARGIPTFVARVPDYVTRSDWDLDLARQIAAFEPDLVVSAGFMKVLAPAMLGGHRIVNTHPALLPSFPGVARRARRDGPRRQGHRVHVPLGGCGSRHGPDHRPARRAVWRTTTPSTPSTSGSRSSSEKMLVDVVRAPCRRPLLARRLTDARQTDPSGGPRAQAAVAHGGTTAPASATGSSPTRSGRTGCTRSWTACAASGWSSGSGSSRRWSTPTPTWPGRTPNGSWRPATSCRSSRATSRCSTSPSRGRTST